MPLFDLNLLMRAALESAPTAERSGAGKSSLAATAPVTDPLLQWYPRPLTPQPKPSRFLAMTIERCGLHCDFHHVASLEHSSLSRLLHELARQRKTEVLWCTPGFVRTPRVRHAILCAPSVAQATACREDLLALMAGFWAYNRAAGAGWRHIGHDVAIDFAQLARSADDLTVDDVRWRTKGARYSQRAAHLWEETRFTAQTGARCRHERAG